VEVAVILAVKGSENKVTILLRVGNEAKRCGPERKLLDRDNTAWWEASDDSVRASCADERCIWFRFDQV
jgi:hypothetical protein